MVCLQMFLNDRNELESHVVKGTFDLSNPRQRPEPTSFRSVFVSCTKGFVRCVTAQIVIKSGFKDYFQHGLILIHGSRTLSGVNSLLTCLLFTLVLYLIFP